jgi:predicted ATP-grasp superfamily ATP-dependent carboligase
VASGRRLRILLCEGSSLSARQTLYALGRTGAIFDVCDPQPLFCLARYSRYVRACYRCPPFALDPEGYRSFLCARLGAERYDVLLPVHDEVFLVARFQDDFRRRVGLAVPPFPALERLQSKSAFVRVLDELGLPHPPTTFVRTRAELRAACRFPCYLKLPYSTAGCGVWLVRDPAEAEGVADRLEAARILDGRSEVLVQQPAPGVLGVVQAVFQDGRLLAGHCYQARALGVGGSARARVSAFHPPVLDQVAALGAFLGWHGAMALDYLWDTETGQPSYIDANPRIGETFNATQSGVNLAATLVQVAFGRPVAALPPSRPGVRTHGVLMNLLAAAERGASRRALLAELVRGLLHRGLYAGSQDELTRPREDLLSALPPVFLVGQLLVTPRWAERIIHGTVDRYALTEKAARAIRAPAAPGYNEHSLPGQARLP